MRGRYRTNRTGAALALALCGAAPAFAADAPARPERLRQCAAEGAGFYYIPGSDTCLRLGGYLWAETYYNSYTDYPARNDRLYWVATYGFEMDARTRTDYGTLRSYMDLRMIWRTADPYSDGASEPFFQPWDMHIEFGGLTAGFTQSFFDFYANANVLGTDPATIGDQTRLPLLGYTWSLGNGYTASLSLEDSAVRDAGLLSADATISPDGFRAATRLPDIVAVFGQTADWGQFQLSGALHQIAAGAGSDDAIGTSSDEWGYALQAGVMFNLPQIAAGDTLYLQAAYADGAISYLGLIDPSGDFTAPDAFVRGDGRLARARGWSVVGQYLHNWNAQWNSAVFGGYGTFDITDPLARVTYGANGVGNFNAGANLTWSPVDPLAITLQYDYNLYRAQDWRATEAGLPVASQQAHQLMLLVARTF